MFCAMGFIYNRGTKFNHVYKYIQPVELKTHIFTCITSYTASCARNTLPVYVLQRSGGGAE